MGGRGKAKLSACRCRKRGKSYRGKVEAFKSLDGRKAAISLGNTVVPDGFEATGSKEGEVGELYVWRANSLDAGWGEAIYRTVYKDETRQYHSIQLRVLWTVYSVEFVTN